MSFGTVLLVLGTGLLIFLVTLQLLRRGRIPVKFSILWFIVAVILLVVGIFPNFIVLISTRIGFISMSNMLVGILICNVHSFNCDCIRASNKNYVTNSRSFNAKEKNS